jgi:alpha-tubulin suppressor-like RCC1 family protein
MGSHLLDVNLGSGLSVQQLSLGGSHSCALLDYGIVKCWGDNDHGQLGQGDLVTRGSTRHSMGNHLQPIYFGMNTIAENVAAGGNHTCAQLSDGTVRCWGGNGGGQLGYGDIVERGGDAATLVASLSPVQLGVGQLVEDVAAGSSLSCGLLSVGAVKCWGHNGLGELGLGDTQNRGDQPGEMGAALPAADPGSGRTVQVLAVGDHHVCATLDEQTVKCWGYNEFVQLGLGDAPTRGDEPGEMGDALPAVELGTR